MGFEADVASFAILTSVDKPSTHGVFTLYEVGLGGAAARDSL